MGQFLDFEPLIQIISQIFQKVDAAAFECAEELAAPKLLLAMALFEKSSMLVTRDSKLILTDSE